MKNNVLKLLGLIAVSTLGQFPVYSVNSITHIETLVSKGWITLGDASSLSGTTNIPSAGGVTIGYFSSSAPSDSTIASWVLANTASNNIVGNLVSNSWVDIRTIIATGAVMQATGDWDWPGGGNPGTAGTKIGGTYNWAFSDSLKNTQLYIFGFNGGTSGYGYDGTNPLAASTSAFSSSSFRNSTQWVALKASNWLLPSTDNTSLELKITDIDTTSELLFGIDMGANVSMIPEPSSISLFLSGLILVLFMLKNRKKQGVFKAKSVSAFLATFVVSLNSFSFADTVSTPIVGFSKINVPQGSRAVVPGFVKASIFSGSGVVSGQTIAASGLTSSALVPAGTPAFPTHYVEIVSGVYEGYSFDVISNSSTSVTVSGLPEYINGQSVNYVIRPHLTLGDIDSTNLPEGSVILNIFNDPNSPVATYVYDSAGNWYNSSGSLLMNHAVIYPGYGIALKNDGVTAFDITFKGTVKTTKTAIPVYKSATVNLIGPMNPSTSTTLTSWAAPLPDDTLANILSTTGNLNVSLTLVTDPGSTILYSGSGAQLSSVSLDGQNAFSMSGMSVDGYVVFNSPINNQ